MVSSAAPRSQYSHHADRFSSALFASLWVDAWGDQYPVQVAPFSSCTHRLLGQLEQQSGLRPGDVLVDLGCGTGGVGLWLAERQHARLIGVDRCCDATAIAADRAAEWPLAEPASFVVADFCSTGLPSAAADAVISVDACTGAADIEGTLSEVRRILKPGGVFLFTARLLGPASRHYETVGPDWSRGLEQSGFRVTDRTIRPEVSGLWQSLYGQWLKHEKELRCELRPETVDGLVAEATRGMQKMSDGRPWYLIRATVAAATE
ncbi:MAG: class I SAM-dependent DNA methyltransferase [Pseudomonadota bacterium]